MVFRGVLSGFVALPAALYTDLMLSWKRTVSDNHSTVFKPLEKSYRIIQICVEQMLCLDRKQSYSHSYYHRNTGMKVYSPDVNIVYGSDQNRASHLLKVTGASNNNCLHVHE